MIHSEDFLYSIAQAPESLCYRLMWADWLEEHHELEWAEFIRLQCAMAGHNPHSEPYRNSLERTQKLLSQKAFLWDRFFIGQMNYSAIQYRFGLPEGLVVDCQEFAKMIHWVSKRIPLKELTLHGDSRFLRPILNHSFMTRLSRLKLQRLDLNQQLMEQIEASQFAYNQLTIELSDCLIVQNEMAGIRG